MVVQVTALDALDMAVGQIGTPVFGIADVVDAPHRMLAYMPIHATTKQRVEAAKRRRPHVRGAHLYNSKSGGASVYV